MIEERREATGRRCVLAASILWSLSGVVAKRLDLDPIAIAFYRSAFAGLVLLPFVPRARWVFRWAMIPNVIVFAAMIASYIAAIKLTTAANAIFLQETACFWMVPLSLVFLGERPDRRSLVGIALALVGIAAIVTRGYSGRPGEGWGVALALASGLAYAWVAVGLRRLRGLDPTWLSAVNNLGGAIALAIGTFAWGASLSTPDLGQAATLLAFGVIQMAIPYALFARGLRDIGAPEAGLISLLEPILNPVWVFLLMGEQPATATYVGGAFVLLGVLCRYLPVTGGRRSSLAGDPEAP